MQTLGDVGMNAVCINELGMAIVGRDGQKLSDVAIHLSHTCTASEIKKVWKTVEAELTSKDIVWVQETLADKTMLLELSKPLSEFELQQKQVIESSFCDFLKSFAERGNDLMHLRDNKLYRNEYPNWETYCQFKLGISYRHAHRLIEAAIVVNQLKIDEQLVLPGSESIAREVAKVKPIIRPLIWETVVVKAEDEDEPITASFVATVVRDFKTENKTKKCDIELSRGELVQFHKGKTKLWGEVKNIYSDGTCAIYDGSKEVIVSMQKLSKLDGNYLECSRVNALQLSTDKVVEQIVSSFHSVFKFQDWHLQIINILEEQCCN